MSYFLAVLRSTYLSQICNVGFTYRTASTPVANNGSPTLLKAMGLNSDGTIVADSILALIQNFVNPSFVFQDLTIKDIHSELDFFEGQFAADTAGDNTGATAPSFAAYSFRTNRGRGDIRRGFKRFAGVTEDSTTGNAVTDMATQTALQNAATAFSQTLTGATPDTTLSFTPVVLGRQQYNKDTGEASTTSGIYRFYPTAALQDAHYYAITAWNASLVVTTQNSRKQGRGI
jgi:hypothetical protein